jgi:hypothetical protein
VVKELRSLAERRGWTADESVAMYEPEPGGWIARVRWVRIVGHRYYRFQIAVIDPRGHAAYTCFATMLSGGWRVAEGNARRHDGDALRLQAPHRRPHAIDAPQPTRGGSRGRRISAPLIPYPAMWAAAGSVAVSARRVTARSSW